jgi:hypothetical protein
MMQQQTVTTQQPDLLNNLQTIRARMGLKRAMFNVLVQKSGYRVVRVESPTPDVDTSLVHEEQWEMLNNGEDRSIG